MIGCLELKYVTKMCCKIIRLLILEGEEEEEEEKDDKFSFHNFMKKLLHVILGN